MASCQWSAFSHQREGEFSLHTISQIQQYVHAFGVWGPVMAILLIVLHSVTFIPSEVLTIADMVLFGPVLGALYAWVGAMLGAYLAYYLAKWLGRPIVNRFVNKRALKRADDFVRYRGAWGILVLRLIPLVSFNALNYALGLSGLTFWSFTWTTGIGILPAILVIALLYKSTTGQHDAMIALAIIGILLLIILMIRLWLKKRK